MKVIQLCLTLSNPVDYTVHGILQVIILEWVAFPFPRESCWSYVLIRDMPLMIYKAIGKFFNSFEIGKPHLLGLFMSV